MAWENTSTENLWAVRTNMVQGAVATAMNPNSRGEPIALAQLQVVLVASVDAALAARGEKVPPPIWA